MQTRRKTNPSRGSPERAASIPASAPPRCAQGPPPLESGHPESGHLEFRRWDPPPLEDRFARARSAAGAVTVAKMDFTGSPCRRSALQAPFAHGPPYSVRVTARVMIHPGMLQSAPPRLSHRLRRHPRCWIQLSLRGRRPRLCAWRRSAVMLARATIEVLQSLAR